MALYKREEVWWVDIHHKGKRIRKTTGTEIKEDAQRVHDQFKHELWAQATIKSIPKKSWMDAVVRWLEESTHKRSLVTDKIHLAWLDQFFRTKKLCEIDRDLIDWIAKKKEAENVSPTTVNRVLELVRAILNRAHKEWGWLEVVPSIRMRKVENKRIRWLTKQEVNGLLKELPSHLKAMASFTLATGLRESNVTQLKWSQVNLIQKHALIHADESKSKRPIPVPLNKQALTILKSQLGKHPVFVFTYQGHPVTRCNNHAWQKALKRAGIDNFRWHDLGSFSFEGAL
ncbi:site-specific integrase [Legionella taurinensis]|uniref:Site-specific integrase n=1 Tax=Legionella taurinensis TaxID=70611 RepID=A0AB38N198_9GAMM|nr:site-specific integrase [Legionella taurinensis]PUT39332.1 site-specific integrase [Legionella taurinensis]PUT41056.1 site-specific integrase [Legionella taurinensis]PUT44486.1 site-specific integrase [Legionella taurinensis]TID31441.1 site-specific integrase [Legionella taurinensis]